MAHVQVFDVVVSSCKEGCRKPEPRIYDIVLERIGLKDEPSQAMFFDDIGRNRK